MHNNNNNIITLYEWLMKPVTHLALCRIQDLSILSVTFRVVLKFSVRDGSAALLPQPVYIIMRCFRILEHLVTATQADYLVYNFHPWPYPDPWPRSGALLCAWVAFGIKQKLILTRGKYFVNV